MPKKIQAATKLSADRQELKTLCESDLIRFINTIMPKRLLGNVHREAMSWWTSSTAKSHQLLLLPRDHMKSALIALRGTWELTRDPSTRILLISSTANLAIKQLKFMKDILTSDAYRTLWPEMVNKEEAKRELWTAREISVDHPKRKDESIRDPSIFTAGLTTNIVGMHSDITILDDVVVTGNAYTAEGRDKVKDQYSLLSSIETANAREWVVGTRYHPKDLYSDLIQMEVEYFDELGNVSRTQPLFDVFERQVESIGDGTGEFLWPKQQRSDGKWFGFDQEVLSKKKAQYLNKVHFRAQYYNDPHDVDSSAIQRDLFQYYEQGFLSQRDGKWFLKGERLNVFAAVDFAYSTGLRSDSSSIVVVGVDGQSNYYILEIDRFKTDKISEYFNRILRLHEKWGFRKLRAEVSAAQAVIVKDLKDNYIRPYGLSLSVEDYRPSRWQGSKEERIQATLEPKYANHQIWHYLGGNCQALEEELIYANPAHDDIKDCLSSVIDFAIAPLNVYKFKKDPQFATVSHHSRFGGVV